MKAKDKKATITPAKEEVPVIVCVDCGCVLTEDSANHLHDETLCDNCMIDRGYNRCVDCGEWTAVHSGYIVDGDVYCHHCFDNAFVYCNCCDRILCQDEAYYYDEEPYCETCYHERTGTNAIHDYGFKPYPIFRGEGPRFYGVELEIDDGGEYDDSAEDILAIGNQYDEDHIYCKHDGSLDEGFEIVSHPMSIDYHLNTMPWKDILHKAIRLGYSSHNAGTCGLHVHVTKAALGEDETARDETIGRILFFVEKNWEELLKFSRRTESQMDQWAARYGLHKDPQSILEHAKGGGSGRGRYMCVNLTNTNTVEFRMFRGTLKLNTFYATLQMVDTICNVALSLSDNEIQALSWSSFVQDFCNQPELIRYLKERRIYVNEPVLCEEEI